MKNKKETIKSAVLLGLAGLITLTVSLFLSGRLWADDTVSNLSTEEVKARENKTLDLLSRIDAFSEEDPNLKMDAARAHYNMGNIYFEKGEFEIAAREYYQAVTLMPDDPEAHYNLAFVSGEYLNDQTTALKHYQIYLFLKPNAEDRDLVNEKIISAKLTLGSKIDSSLDKQQ